MRVLLVDDDPDALELVATLLGLEGADVVTAANSDDALLLLRQRPHVIVSDLEMPEGGGLHLVRRVRGRSNEHGGATPAIALTAHKTVLDQTRALLAGFQVHLGKPVRADALIAEVARLGRSEAVRNVS